VFDDDGQPRKLTDLFAGGPDPLLRALRSNLGLPVNHFAMVSLGGFIDIVRTLGTVEVCLERPLFDARAVPTSRRAATRWVRGTRWRSCAHGAGHVPTSSASTGSSSSSAPCSSACSTGGCSPTRHGPTSSSMTSPRTS
jgi:hypothetical protein